MLNIFFSDMAAPQNKKAMAEAMAKALARGTKRDARETDNVARISGGLLGLAVGGAEVGPIDIGAEVFAADGAIRCFLDRWAMLGWHLPHPVFPLRHNGWRYA